MHVHIGRDHFEDNNHIRNFCWFFNNPANTEFLRGASFGRQSQTWVRFPEGWRIVAAHISNLAG